MMSADRRGPDKPQDTMHAKAVLLMILTLLVVLGLFVLVGRCAA